MRRTKYNAKSCRCNQGHIHHSRAEAAYCDNLYLDMKDLNAGPENKITEIENQPTIELVAGIRWKLDFRVWRGLTEHYLVDVKGMETREFQLKLKLYRWMLKEGDVWEPLLIAHAHQNRGMVTFSESWYPKSAGERR